MKRLNAPGVALLVLLNVLALAALGQVEWNALNFGSYGLTWGDTGTVHDVVAGGAAARAGIVSGDRVDLAAMSPEDRMAFLFPNSGEQIDLPLLEPRRTV